MLAIIIIKILSLSYSGPRNRFSIQLCHFKNYASASAAAAAVLLLMMMMMIMN